jgi:hypothetical protein
VARKYAFNPLKIRFQSTLPKHFFVLSSRTELTSNGAPLLRPRTGQIGGTEQDGSSRLWQGGAGEELRDGEAHARAGTGNSLDDEGREVEHVGLQTAGAGRGRGPTLMKAGRRSTWVSSRPEQRVYVRETKGASTLAGCGSGRTWSARRHSSPRPRRATTASRPTTC